MPKILIIEDDKEICHLLSDFLGEYGYETICKHEGRRISETLQDCSADLILLDLMLPYKSGDQILAQIRSCSNIPVIVISAKGTTQNKIDLLRLGADDYITKPFDLEETLARIECNLRRANLRAAPDCTLKFQELTLDPSAHTVYIRDQELLLTSKEYQILELLMRHPEKIFSKSNLFESVWNSDYSSEDNTLNVHISNLRNKLRAASSNQEYIDTVWGIGYRLHKS
ncbi:response regulator transcription factor [Anaerostipes sp.]|uniref:response regulator transcription factor n=1 Tax=Anaerostipes sp. TaxID=1872530 RepID=UPI0025C2AFA2|nr:response regulator transcription factor [Anaerostipes sp.]MBS7008396.1 response regulator transcription factor [Anaerostipes sp.]